MTNSIITCIRRLDPASEYSSVNHDDGAWVVWACYGEVAIAEYATQASAEAHLARCKQESRTLRSYVVHNWWRLVHSVERVAWRMRPVSYLDQIIP